MAENHLDSFIGAYRSDFSFDLDNRLILNAYPRRVLALCQSRGSLLELGLGHGTTTRALAGHFARHVVIDGSPAIIQMFRAANRDLEHVEIIESWFERYVTTERFDVICMGFVLEHVDDPRAILRRFRSLLAPDGRLVVTVPNGTCLHRRFAHAAGILPDMMQMGPGDHALGHKRLYSREVLEAELTATGFEIVQLEGLFLKPLMTSQLKALDISEPILGGMVEVGRDYPELCSGMMAVCKAAE